MSSGSSPVCYRFAGFELQPDQRRFLRDGVPVDLRPLTLDVLTALADAQGRLVTKADLRRRVWGNIVVEDNALQAHISALRKILGHEAVVTVPGSGYRLSLAVTRVTSPAHNLPYALTLFIGREREQADVARRLTSGRLLTLTGAGGCGKTRLALEVAHACADTYADGAWFVELAPLLEPTLLPNIVARTLSIDPEPGRDLMETLIDRLAPRRLLLLLDNAEHLLDASAKFLDRVLRQCIGVVALVTSRERLGLEGEQTYRVPSLTVPGVATSDNVLASEAARLFVDRARLHLPDFEPAGADSEALSAICRRLDGIALAIELAAPLTRIMSLRSLSERLDNRFDVLAAGPRAAMPRHRTLRGLIDWSHELLSPAERVVFRRLAVFVGGIALDVAQAVCSGKELEPHDVEAVLASLAEKNLVGVGVDGDDTRFDMLETVRHYAGERLRAIGETEAIHARHLDWFCELARGAQFGMSDDDALPRLARLARERDNVRAALAWSEASAVSAHRGLALAGMLNRYWQYNGSFSEGQNWIARLLLAAPMHRPDDVYAQAFHAAASLASCDASFQQASEFGRMAVDCWRQLGNDRRLALSLGLLGEIESFGGNLVQAATHHEAALVIARRLGDERAIAQLLTNLGFDALLQGELESAQVRLEEALLLARRAGLDPLASAVGSLAVLRREQGDFEAARDLLIESSQIWRTLGYGLNLSRDLQELAKVHVKLGEAESAIRAVMEALDSAPASRTAWTEWLGCFAVVYAALRDPLWGAKFWGCALAHTAKDNFEIRTLTRQMTDAVRQRGGDDAAFDRAMAEGGGWSLDDAIELARSLVADRERE